MPGGAAHGLDERALGAQKALFVRVQDRNQRHLWKVEALAQEVDADQHVELAEAQIANDLDPLYGFDLGVQVSHLHAVLGEIFREFFGHPLGQGGHQDAFLLLHPQMNFGKQIVDLAGSRSHQDLGIDQTGRPHHLFHHLRRFLALVLGRRRRDEDRLAHHRLELVETQRPVVESGRQAEAVLDQVLLARAVALVHPAELRNSDVALIDDHQGVGRQVVDEGRRRLAGLASRQMPRIILDPLAEAQLGEHLEVEAGALLDALRLDQAPGLLEEIDALAQLRLDRLDSAKRSFARRYVVARRVDGEPRHRVLNPAGQRVENLELFNRILVQGNSNCMLRVFRGEDVDHVAAHAERAAPEIELVAVVLHGDEAREDFALRHLLALAQVQDHAVILGRIADAVDRRHRADDDDVAPLEQ